MSDPTSKTTDLTSRVASAMWAVYQASLIVGEGSAGMTWDRLCELADNGRPGNAASVIRNTGLAEAEAAIAVVKAALHAE